MRRPAKFWTAGEGYEAVKAHVTGKLSEADAVARIVKATPTVGEAETLADVRWYARDVRRALGLPGIREQKSAAKAKQEIAAQE